ncbi:NAD(+) kinase [Elasticomyces elasticus]|nr:NAD(+) kinase [Elasticomyces elasticus]
MEDRQNQTTPGTPTSTRQHTGGAMAEAMARRTPIRRDSFDRPNGFPQLDSTPRRFSTGAGAIPMPAPQVFAAQVAAEAELDEKRSRMPNARETQHLESALNQFKFCSDTPSIARLAALTSPCYLHKRFGDAVDIDKVLEEIKGDDQLSHSRLMQTAASVREVSRQLQRRPLKRAVRNVMVITKARDNTLVSLTRELAKWLLVTPRYGKDIGVNVWVDSKLRKSKRFGVDSLLEKDTRYKDMLRFWTPALCLEQPELFDLVITLGGDGTVLFTSWLFQRIVPPVLSFSLGSLGFLTNFDFEQYKHQLNKIMGDTGMRINMRMRFTCTVYRSAASTASSAASSASLSTTTTRSNTLNTVASDPQSNKIEGETHEVLNELVIDRGPSSYISSLDLYANDSLLTRISADGIILSTPTGSTAYSLSAGGSLVHPDIPAILLTPICPHTLSFRPMLLNDDMALKVSIPSTGRGGAFVSFDGKGRVELGRGDEVVVRASQYPFPTVMGQPLEWFDSISRTLRWNTRAAEQKDWAGGAAGHGEGDGAELVEGEEQRRSGVKEAEFDIDFAEEEVGGSGRDSGYGGTESEGGRTEREEKVGWQNPQPIYDYYLNDLAEMRMLDDGSTGWVQLAQVNRQLRNEVLPMWQAVHDTTAWSACASMIESHVHNLDFCPLSAALRPLSKEAKHDVFVHKKFKVTLTFDANMVNTNLASPIEWLKGVRRDGRPTCTYHPHEPFHGVFSEESYVAIKRCVLDEDHVYLTEEWQKLDRALYYARE